MEHGKVFSRKDHVALSECAVVVVLITAASHGLRLPHVTLCGWSSLLLLATNRPAVAFRHDLSICGHSPHTDLTSAAAATSLDCFSSSCSSLQNPLFGCICGRTLRSSLAAASRDMFLRATRYASTIVADRERPR